MRIYYIIQLYHLQILNRFQLRNIIHNILIMEKSTKL